jgi:hypothetical protein
VLLNLFFNGWKASAEARDVARKASGMADH